MGEKKNWCVFYDVFSDSKLLETEMQFDLPDKDEAFIRSGELENYLNNMLQKNNPDKIIKVKNVSARPR